MYVKDGNKNMFQNKRKQFEDMEYFFIYVTLASELYGNEDYLYDRSVVLVTGELCQFCSTGCLFLKLASKQQMQNCSLALDLAAGVRSARTLQATSVVHVIFLF